MSRVPSTTYILADPRFRWQELRSGDITLRYHDLNRSAVEPMIEGATATVQRVVAMLGLGEMKPFTIYVYNSVAELSVVAFQESRATNQFYGGFAYADEGVLLVVRSNDTDGRQLLAHEVAHLVTGHAVD